MKKYLSLQVKLKVRSFLINPKKKYTQMFLTEKLSPPFLTKTDPDRHFQAEKRPSHLPRDVSTDAT